jgi:hypothetical protein
MISVQPHPGPLQVRIWGKGADKVKLFFGKIFSRHGTSRKIREHDMPKLFIKFIAKLNAFQQVGNKHCSEKNGRMRLIF